MSSGWINDQRGPRPEPQMTSATAVRVTAITTKTERERKDRSAQGAQERSCRAVMIHPTSGGSASADTAWAKKLAERQDSRDLGVIP